MGLSTSCHIWFHSLTRCTAVKKRRSIKAPGYTRLFYWGTAVEKRQSRKAWGYTRLFYCGTFLLQLRGKSSHRRILSCFIRSPEIAPWANQHQPTPTKPNMTPSDKVQCSWDSWVSFYRVLLLLLRISGQIFGFQMTSNIF